MENTGHYTDTEFQQYLDNRFAGNREVFQDHLRICDLCKEQLIVYRSVFSYLQTDFELAEPSFSVATEVADIVFASLWNPGLVERIMVGVIIGVALFAFGFCFSVFVEASFTLAPLAVALILVGFLAFLSFTEIRMMRRSLLPS